MAWRVGELRARAAGCLGALGAVALAAMVGIGLAVAETWRGWRAALRKR